MAFELVEVRESVKVLLQGRSTKSIQASPGGDQVKLEETCRALRDRGVDAVASADLRPDLRGYDAVHLFGLTRPQDVWVQARNAVAQGVPIALSPIYLDVWELERTSRDDLVGKVSRRLSRDRSEAIKAVGRAVVRREAHRGVATLVTRGFRRMQLEVMDWSGVFLPDSNSEWARCLDDLEISVPDDRVFVAPNGVGDVPDVAHIPAPEHLARYEGCVLCVARLEARKNQLNLVEAMRGVDVDLVLVGQPSPNQQHYAEAVRAAAGPRTHVLGALSDRERDALYALAKVHVLPSWLETTGLSSLEAALRGCTLVVSPNGDTREYFGDQAFYCDPGDPRSIRGAVERALTTDADAELASRLTTSLTWSETARKTESAYRALLDG